jgi:ATP-dependent Clp protease ATP-binding subunit ClpA
MFEEYSRGLENVFIMAGYEAERLGAGHTGTEHVLLAVLEEVDRGGARAPRADPAAEALKALGLSTSGVLSVVEAQLETCEERRPAPIRPTGPVKRPITKQLGECLRRARDSRDTVEPVHLLVAIFNCPRAAASGVVEELGISARAVRDTLEGLAERMT